MSVLCNINMGCVCVEGRWRFSRIISSVTQLDYAVSSCADWFFGVFSRFCSISRVFCFSRVEGFVFLCWICVSPVADASRVNIPGSLVVVLVLTSVFLVKISD